ncbi:MAG TPA: hypothetical protein V6D05_01960, partial [Stenomitos sp.]
MSTPTLSRPASGRSPSASFDLPSLAEAIRAFNLGSQLGVDPLARLYPDRRAAWSLFSVGLRDAELEALRLYLFPTPLPSTPDDPAVVTRNFIAGEWRIPANGRMVAMPCLWDKRITLAQVPDSQQADVELAVGYAHDFWKSMEWAAETVQYRKFVVNNFARLLEYYA